MILISVQISVHYYPHVIEFDVQNCQLSIKHISWNVTAGKSYTLHHILSCCECFWVYNVFQVSPKEI